MTLNELFARFDKLASVSSHNALTCSQQLFGQLLLKHAKGGCYLIVDTNHIILGLRTGFKFSSDAEYLMLSCCAGAVTEVLICVLAL